MASVKSPSYFSRLWQRYRALKLPWRKHFLAGVDLHGNEYYFFRPTLSVPHSPSTSRRIFRPRHSSRATHASLFADMTSTIPPQWHQWLRYTRPDPPSLAELQADVGRRERVQALVAARSQREEEERLLVGDDRSNSGRRRAIGGVDTKDLPPSSPASVQRPAVDEESDDLTSKKRTEKEKVKSTSPWDQDRQRGQVPGAQYQPASWDPSAASSK